MSTINEKETIKQNVKPPSMWNVVIINDDFTTFEFVVACLVNIFGKSVEEAIILTQKVHNNGKAIAGQYAKDIAETKQNDAILFARQYDHPLLLTLEKVD